MHNPQDARLPGDYSHILPPEKPKQKKYLDGKELEEVTYPLHRPPLSTEDLHDIGVRNRGSKDVIALLHEIKRLRAHVLRADQLLRSMTGLYAHEAILRSLAGEIKDEPCIQELRRAWAPKAGPDTEDG